MAAPTRFAVVGLDHWYSAVPLARLLAQRADTELAGIADRDQARATEVAESIGDIRVTTQESELIEDPSIDVVASFVSVERNPAVCLAAAAAGKHIISVKPLARTLAEADHIRSAVRANGVQFLPSESRSREAANNQLLAQWVREGRLGRIVSANLTLSGGLPHAWPGQDDPGWWIDPERVPGGAWIDHSIYQIDLMRWLLGEEIAAVSGHVGNLRHRELAVEDYGHAICRFAGGAVVTVEDTWTAPPGAHRTTTTILGTEGGVSIDSLTGAIAVTGSAGTFEGWTQGRAGASHAEGVDALLAALRGEAPLATVDDAWENLSACLAFYTAARSGTVVSPDHLPA